MKHAAIRTCAALLLLALLVVVPRSLFAAELVKFNSAGTAPSPFAIKKAKAKGIELKAEPGIPLTGLLSKPSGNGPFPAVVLLHECRGMESYQGTWADKLTSWGYVALRVDSFKPRGVEEVCTDFNRVVDGEVQFDAYGAATYLRRQPFVDPDRIGVMGWGYGGGRGLAIVTEDGVQQFFEHKFRAAVALYGGCRLGFDTTFIAPVMMLMGEKDDWSPAAVCQRNLKARQAGPHPFVLNMYPDAYGGFDNPELGEMFYYKDAENINKTPARGATLGYNRAAHEDALKRVNEFLAKHLK